jgi:hypothetical protein
VSEDIRRFPLLPAHISRVMQLFRMPSGLKAGRRGVAVHVDLPSAFRFDPLAVQ